MVPYITRYVINGEIMREVGMFKAKTHLSALVDEVGRGETVIITKRGRPVVRLTSPEAPNRGAAVTAVQILRDMRKRIGWATTEEILQMRDEGRR